jgi:hypothetical protein
VAAELGALVLRLARENPSWVPVDPRRAVPARVQAGASTVDHLRRAGVDRHKAVGAHLAAVVAAQATGVVVVDFFTVGTSCCGGCRCWW